MRIGGGAVSIADVTDRVARDLGFVRPFWLNEIRAGRAFAAGTTFGADPGENSHVQVFNPAASGITVIMRRALINGGVDSMYEIATHNVALTTLIGQGVNMLSGGGASLAEWRSQSIAGLSGTQFGRVSLLAETTFEMMKDWQIELGEGEGVLIRQLIVAQNVRVTMEWIEV